MDRFSTKFSSFVMCIFCTALFTAVSAQIPVGDTPKQVAVKTKTAVLRVDPSVSSRAVGTAQKNAVLDVYAYEPNTKWYLVKYKGLHGWIRAASVAPVLKLYTSRDEDLPDIPDLGNIIDTEQDVRSIESRGWKQFGSSKSSGNIQFFKDSTLQFSGDIAKVWAKTYYVSTQHEMDRMISVNCKQMEFTILESIEYDGTGKSIQADDFKASRRFASIPPDSVISELARTICKRSTETYY